MRDGRRRGEHGLSLLWGRMRDCRVQFWHIADTPTNKSLCGSVSAPWKYSRLPRNFFFIWRTCSKVQPTMLLPFYEAWKLWNKSCIKIRQIMQNLSIEHLNILTALSIRNRLKKYKFQKNQNFSANYISYKNYFNVSILYLYIFYNLQWYWEWFKARNMWKH